MKICSHLHQPAPLEHRLDFVCYYDSALALRNGLDPYTGNLSSIGTYCWSADPGFDASTRWLLGALAMRAMKLSVTFARDPG